MIVFLYIFTLFIVFLLLKFTINWYFKAKKGRFSQNSNYIFKYAIAVLFTAFCFINPSITPHILNWIIEITNKISDLDLAKLNTNIELYSIIIYGILCLAIVFLLNIAFKSRKQKAIQQFVTRQNENELEKKDLAFPEDTFKESPIFHERLKKYFELKYKKQGLTLNVSTKDNLIYGAYNEGFRNYFIVAKYLDNENQIEISEEHQKEVLEDLQSLTKKLKLNEDKTDYLYDFYYIVKEATFTKVNIDNFFPRTEDTILNELIDFRIYLKSLISKYNNEKIFSAIAKDSEKKTLSETFIMPSYSLEEKKSSNLNLEAYIKDWLKNSPVPKHLVLLGDYGMGKTSFLKYFSKKLANEILTNNKVLRFPVFISLNNTSPRHGGIKKTISAFVAENLGVDYELFEILIHKGKILFLLDAFDEMGFVGTHEDRFKQMNEIWKLAYKNNKILLTGRSSYFPSDFELKQTLNIISEEEEVIQTQPYCSSIRLAFLNDFKIKEYISKYYKPDRTEQLFNWIVSAPSILELCKRPSLMHIIREMLPNLQRKDTKEIHNPGGAIEKYVNYWINRQESKEIQSAIPNSHKKREFIKSFFRHIAVQIFMSKQSKISADFIKDELNKFVDKYELKNLSKKYQKEGFENEILTSYFIELDNDNFRFVHKSFFEYFVAKEIISLIKQRKFKSKILFEDWSNSIVNFIYDAIPAELKENKKIPALLLLVQSGILSIIKNSTTRFLLKKGNLLIGIIITIIITTATILYFTLIPWSTTALVLLLLPLLIFAIISLALTTSGILSLISNNKNVKFVIKAFKIAFIKNQFDLKDNLDIVLPLLKRTSAPHIPIENIEFNNESFNDCKFYRLKNVAFNNCKFQIPILSSCHLHNVKFNNSRMSCIVFDKCRLTDVHFKDLKLSRNDKDSQITKHLVSKNGETPLIYFRNCKFDTKSIVNLKLYMNYNQLVIGQDIDGCDDFIKTIS
ncbi:MAG: hypothetical protein COC06_07445 [Bacteroidales bacterium]|nr:MAG: hypothetical protein COC06_07445 [Bacteroidales bacterium]